MPEALTESFCERCGTRYEFAAPTELSPMRRTRGLLSGLKNYILSQDALSDSVGDAMRSQEQLLAEKQLEAFHASFNFCIDCRQYTCLNCWHEDAGRCQSCVPMPGGPTLEERFAAATAIAAAEGAELVATAPGEWPVSDLEVEPEPLPEPEPVFVAEVEPEPLPEPEPEPVFVAEVEPEPLPEPEPVFVAEVEPEPLPEPEPVFVAEVEPEPLPEPPRIPYRPVPPITDTFLHRPAPEPVAPPLAAAADDAETAARRAQLDLLGLGDPGLGPVAPTRNVLPYRSSGAPAASAALRTSSTHDGAFWDASAREVAGAVSGIGVRTCAHCELSLSATARFCRRCGTPQARSA